MSEIIKFFASIESVNAGDEEIRLVLSVKDTPVDLAAAMGMIVKTNRVLSVSAYLGIDAEAVATFPACIPQMKTALQFRKDRPPVIRLDIPACDALQALRLVGYTEKLVRFEVSDEGQKPEKARKTQQRPKKPKGPHSYFWEYLNPEAGRAGAGFVTLAGVREAIEEMRITETEPVWELLHRVFGVGGWTLAYTSPDDVLRKFPDNAKVALFVQRAKIFQQGKESQNNERNGSDSGSENN